MSRGKLRVYLGSAPGVGKTYRMLDEGWRRRDRGTDVVVGFVETHNRPQTAAQIRDLEIMPRIARSYRGTQLEEMDVEAILARRPEVVLVDELAHTNAPGSPNEKRWQDVEQLLDAGIDVITTVNIQHLESVNDVVQKITGIEQKETIPDLVVRNAEQVEIVDMTPEALRRRMAHGNIYAAEKVDAALSNYFRPGNLAALRELALLWLADRVDENLQDYLDAHGIDDAWETRERLIVAVTGTETDDALLHRAARMAARARADLIAVHVRTTNESTDNECDLTQARQLVNEFDGVFHEIVDDDIGRALVAFARSERGTQIVIGSSQRSASSRFFRRDVIDRVLHDARDLDVHVISVGDAPPPPRRQRRRDFHLSVQRHVLGVVVAALALPLLTLAMAALRVHLSDSTVFLVYLATVMTVTAIGGMVIGVVSALAAFVLENYYFVEPLHTFRVSRPDDLVALVAFLVYAVGSSLVLTRFTRRSQEADRARAEAEVLAKAAGTAAASGDDLSPLLDSLRAIFDLDAVAILERVETGWFAQLVSGDPGALNDTNERFDIDEDHVLAMAGASLDAQDRGLLNAFTSRVAVALESQQLRKDAASLQVLADVDALRTGLLRAVSHDLRAPLSVIDENVKVLLQRYRSGSGEREPSELVTIDIEVRKLTRLIVNLLDASRLDAGIVQPHVVPVSVNELVDNALATIDVRHHGIDRDIPADLPLIATDADLVERVIANVVSNACRYCPMGESVRISAGAFASHVEIIVIDKGVGIPEEQRAAAREPVGNWKNDQSGVGLGLSVANGFTQLLGGELRFDDTPGGGLTVSIVLPLEPVATSLA